ncbi:histone-lysine n-methyltransferase, suv9 [Aspergillus luchuensis IFO 4308]|nr:histone-lysine n-methyltransferase, suv9 [Aspergillus luchuensis IFO 4308]
MVIDLTLDSDSEERNENHVPSSAPHLQNNIPKSPSTLTHRPASSVPSKRKSEDVDELLASFLPRRPQSQPRSFSQPQPTNRANQHAISIEIDDDDEDEDVKPIQSHRRVTAARSSSFNPNTVSSAGKENRPLQIKSNATSTRSSSPFTLAATKHEPRHSQDGDEDRKQSSLLSTRRSLSFQTPSPGPISLSVVIPSPSRRQQQEIDSADVISVPSPIGLSENFYPTDAYEKRALKGAYPVARKVDRAAIPFTIGAPGPLLTSKPDINAQLHQTLQLKLAKIRGPKVTFASGDQHQLAQFAANFEFVNAYKLRQGVTPVPEEFLAGCSCDGFCDPARCLCLSKEEETNDPMVPYKRAEDDGRLLVLTPEFLKRKVMIYELQNGRTVRLEIFWTGSRGFGEVITKEVADIREDATSQKGPSYLFSLDFLATGEDSKYVIDGHRFGNPTRFINHSCNPNCRLIPVTRNHADDYLYDLAFFALRDVPPMTELTFDYNPGWEKVRKVDPNAVPCLCGESNCRGQLWPNQRKAKRG